MLIQDDMKHRFLLFVSFSLYEPSLFVHFHTFFVFKYQTNDELKSSFSSFELNSEGEKIISISHLNETSFFCEKIRVSRNLKINEYLKCIKLFLCATRNIFPTYRPAQNLQFRSKSEVMANFKFPPVFKTQAA